jgi:DeoR/GlpR family transcriptional regulator of sugar metabolism
MSTDRRQRLLLLSHKQPHIELAELGQILAVSPRTVRSDIKVLATEGHAIRLDGNEVVFEEPEVLRTSSFARRLHVNAAAKRTIARWAARLVEDGDTIFVDASTTVYQMTTFLARRRNLVVLTNGIEIGRRLAENASNVVMLVAGVIRPDGSSVTGPVYEPVLRNRHIKTAFVSCKGFSPAAGLTETDSDEAAVKNQLIGLAEATVALIDSSKFGQVYRSPFARAAQIAHIFSDDALEQNWAEQVQHSSIVLTSCR